MSLKLLIQSRKYFRKVVTENHNKRSTFSLLSLNEKRTVRCLLEDYLSQLRDLNGKIQTLKWDESEDEAEIENELKTCHDYSCKIRECLSLLEEASAASQFSPENARSLLKRPTAPLPTFTSSEGEDLNKFFLEFEETISKFSYPDYDKLLLLKQQVSGRALVLLNALESDKQAYSHAKDLLVSALASPDVQKFNVIKQLSEMKLPYDSDPFAYISKIKYITESVKKLNIDMDTILQYFFLLGMNDSFKAQLVQITNHTRPSLKEIQDHFFEVCERYQQQKNTKNPKKKTDSNSGSNEAPVTSLAAKVNYEGNPNYKSFKPCSICTKLETKEAAHTLAKCPKFVTGKDKTEQLMKLKGCVKCGNIGHTSDNCKFRFRSRCFKCRDWHMSYLCIKDNNSNIQAEDKSKEVSKEVCSPKGSVQDNVQSSKEKTKKTVTNAITLTENLMGNTEGESILPTFTGIIDGVKVRFLKDGGCQSNFVLEKIASQLGLRVVKDNIMLTVKGINIPKQYHSKLVEAKISFGNEERIVRALCIPSIDISLHIPGLNVIVDDFVRKGYNLADEQLVNCNDKIDNIGFILGTKSGYCVPETEVIFGEEGLSLYSQTPLGVILKGDASQLVRDLSSLSVYNNLMLLGSSCTTGVNDSRLSEYGIDLTLTKSSCLTTSLDFSDRLASNSFSVLDEQGKLNDEELQKATKDILENQSLYYSNYDCNVYDDSSSELNIKLIRYALDNTTRDKDGRLRMPLLWNAEMSHLLGKNHKLATLILKSTLRKLSKHEEKLKLMDKVIKEQVADGIIEKVDDLENFLEAHPEHSFLPHMAVFKPDRETTKCRIVFLSNLSEKVPNQPITISHNQAIHAGPSLNQKISSALIHLRFDEKICCFDVKKAFNNISLDEVDQNRLLFLWFRNIDRRDYSIVAYKNVRLSFGLRCSPALLLLGMYKILILDSTNDPSKLRNLKSLIYQLCYMDNCAFTARDHESLMWGFNQLESIFSPYKFGLQQYVSNDNDLQSLVDVDDKRQTPVKVKLLGMQWDRVEDTLSTRPISLDVNASTKRRILKTIASQFDLYNYNGPILNRSRLFLHRLQCKKDLDWDEQLSPELLREWRAIARQGNSTPKIGVQRFVGGRDGNYKLIAFSDSSKTMYGIVIYIQDLETKKVSFLLAKNRIVNTQLETKSIPSLEVQGLCLATECILDVYEDLAGNSCVQPIKINELEVYTDSLVSLSWLNASLNKLDKMQKRSVFVLNRINHIKKLCEKHPVKFSFVSGTENPSDCITRCLSYKKLMQTNYFSGPKFLSSSHLPEMSREDLLSLIVPHPLSFKEETEESEVSVYPSTSLSEPSESSPLLAPESVSSFRFLVSVHSKVLVFINKLKANLKGKYPDRYSHLKVKDRGHNFYEESIKQIVLKEQKLYFPAVFDFFKSESKHLKDIPNIVNQLNLYIDNDGLLRVKCKLERMKDIKNFEKYKFPLLLSKESKLTSLIVLDMHDKLCHSGCYAVLRELRKRFWVPSFFSAVKKILRTCVTCRRFNERTIKVNQSPYREFRLSPSNIPFNNVFMDFMGPFHVKGDGKKIKVWILCITCMWSRAINLKICMDQSVTEFLRGFQLHCYEYGIPSYCITDLGTQLTAGGNIITGFLKDHESQGYFKENGIEPIKFEHYFKGHSELGGMVEICVKLTKKLLYGAIGKNVLTLRDFEFIVCKTVHLVNRRPIALKEVLRENSVRDIPEAITPEVLIRGYDLPSMNVIPELQSINEEWSPSNNSQDMIRIRYEKLKKVQKKLSDLYNDEYVSNLIHQAVNLKDRYKPVAHHDIQEGDIVLIKDKFCKQSSYPMAVVKQVIRNINDEVTGAIVMKGSTKELLKRHSSCLIPLLTKREMDEDSKVGSLLPQMEDTSTDITISRPQRKAAIESSRLTKAILDEE